VKGTQTLKVHDMPNFVRHKKMWEPSVCMAFADQLLSFVRKMVHKDYHTVCLAMPLFMAFRVSLFILFKRSALILDCYRPLVDASAVECVQGLLSPQKKTKFITPALPIRPHTSLPLRNRLHILLAILIRRRQGCSSCRHGTRMCLILVVPHTEPMKVDGNSTFPPKVS
jgi:hypothetical protein